MKRTILTIAMTLFITIGATAGDEQKYYKVMGEAIGALFAAQSSEDIQPVINKLERISKAEANKWEPYYYTAFAYLRMYERAKTVAEKDEYIDKAIAQVNKGLKVAEAEDELITMKGYAYMMKMVLDPMSRAPEYSPIIMGSYQKALAINKENPRAWYLMGQMQLGTASFMGGSTAEGCQSVAYAVQYFTTDKPATPIDPTWGAEAADEAAAKCQ